MYVCLFGCVFVLGMHSLGGVQVIKMFSRDGGKVRCQIINYGLLESGKWIVVSGK